MKHARSVVRATCLTLLGSLCLPSCAEEDKSGAGGGSEIGVRVYGEAFIEDKVPASPDPEHISDGWEVKFNSFLVEIADVQIAGHAVQLTAPQVDLTTKSVGEPLGQQIGLVNVGPGRYADAAFTLLKVHLTGSATKAGVTKTFDWTFDRPVRYADCSTETRVKDGGSTVFEITMHSDHLFYDTLEAHPNPILMFEPIARADANNDGVITMEELAVTDIDDAFTIGSTPVANMQEWLDAQYLTLAHADGEGHCHATVL